VVLKKTELMELCIWQLIFETTHNAFIGGFDENRIDGTMYCQLISETTHNASDFYK
jgi:hypothetical protein